MGKTFGQPKPSIYSPKKPSRKPGPTSSSPAIDFARQGDMLTPDEVEDCRKGNMTLSGGYLMNLNVASTRSRIPVGAKVRLYFGRGLRIKADALLGIAHDEELHF